MRDNKRGTIEDPANRARLDEILRAEAQTPIPERCAAHDRLHDCPAEQHSVRAELYPKDVTLFIGLSVEIKSTLLEPEQWGDSSDLKRIERAVFDSLKLAPGDIVTARLSKRI